MEWFILSRDLHVLCVPSSEAQDSLPIFDDKQTIVLQNNTVVSTYDFSVQQKHSDATNLKWGNYVVFRDKYGKTRMYTLISHDGDDLVQTWHAEDIGLDLLNETADKWDYTGESHGIGWYFNNLVLNDTGWSIGINEIGNLTRGLKFDGQSDTQLKRLGDIANQFDGAEIDFEVELDGSRITKQVINIYKKVGNPMTQQRFIDAVNLKSLQSSGSIEDLCTAMIGYGSQPDIKDGENVEDVPPIDFADLSYDDGQFFSPKGDKAVYDRLNHLVWSRYSGFDTTNQNETKGYITGIYNYETKDPNELLNRAIAQLKKRNAPSETYEANLLDINADIGDEVQIAHNNYNPPIYLSARVESVTNCYTANGQDTGILGDYQKLESQIDPRIKEMIDQLADQIKPNYTWLRYAKDDKGTGMTSRPTADTKYVAIVSNKPTGVPSDNPADYAGHWQLIKGNDGKDGIPGATGADGKTSYTHIAYANNVSGTADFSVSDPTGRSYMGVYSDFTKADSNNPSDYVWSLTKGRDGLDGAQGIPGKPGVDGKTPYTHVAYADNDKGGGFSQTPANKPYMGWYTDFTQADSTDTTKYAWSLIKGKDGSDGAPGKPGSDGKTPYFHQAWADSKDGKVNFSTTDPTNRGYLGTYSDFTQADSTDPSKYYWTELVGALGIGTPNLIYNAGFKGSGDSVGSDGWTTPPGGWVSRPSTRTGYGGSNGLVINVNQVGDSWQVVSARRVAVQDHNQPYSFAARVSLFNESTGINGLYCELGMYDNDNKWLGSRQTNWLDLNKKDTYQLLMSEDAGLIEGTAFIEFRLAVHTNAAGRVYACISQPILNASDRVAPFSDNQATGADITQINNALAKVDNKIAAFPKVTTSKTAPTSPNKGDQWWVIAPDPVTGDNGINVLKQWDGSTWAEIPITQSLLVIKTLDAVNINGSVINGSKFTNNFDYTDLNKINFKGVTEIANGSYKTDFKIASSNQVGHVYVQPDGLHTYVSGRDGNAEQAKTTSLGFDALTLTNGNTYGTLRAEDIYRIGPESWSNSDAGGTYTIAFERRWGRVWVTGELLIPTSSFGDYHTVFTIKTPGLRPKKNRWFVGMRTGNVPIAGEIEMRPNGEFVAIGVPQGGRYTFEGVSYSLGDE